jgi:hypothetical protein
LAVKPDEAFWQRFLATYRFRRVRAPKMLKTTT